MLPAFLCLAAPSTAGTWQITIKGTGSIVASSIKGFLPGGIQTNQSWTNVVKPPFVAYTFQCDPAQEDTVTVNLNETYTVAVNWQPETAGDSPPDAPLNLVIDASASWGALLNGGSTAMNSGTAPVRHLRRTCVGKAFFQSTGASGSASNGLVDPYVTLNSPIGETSGSSIGARIASVSNGGTLTYNMSVSVTVQVTGKEELFCADGIGACPLRLSPFPPPVLWSTDPVRLYHSTDRATADKFIAGVPLLPLGHADFGYGFYTCGDEAGSSSNWPGDGLQLAKNSAWRRACSIANPNNPQLDWGVVEFDVPLKDMLDFFCNYQDLIVGFNSTDPNAAPPWNALENPGYSFPYQNNPLPTTVTAMNWLNFAWFNWFAWRCTSSLPAPNTDLGDPDDEIDWQPLDAVTLPDWQMALIWGKLYSPQRGCGPPGGKMPPGAE